MHVRNMAGMMESGKLIDIDGSLLIGIREADAVESCILQSNEDALLIIKNISQIINS
jgi:hypothetical protein